MVATHTDLFRFPQLPLAARKCYVFPVLQQPLLSLGQFCNVGFMATLTSDTVLLTKYGSTTLSGTRYNSVSLLYDCQIASKHFW